MINVTWIFLSLKDSFMEHQLGIAIAVTMFLKQEEYQSKIITDHDSWIPGLDQSLAAGVGPF